MTDSLIHTALTTLKSNGNSKLLFSFFLNAGGVSKISIWENHS